MDKTDETLKALGIQLKYEELTPEERDTFHQMLSSMQNSVLTVEKLKEYIITMRESVTLALVDEPEFSWNFIFKVANRKQILLKARLQNYVLLEAFLYSPERAKKALERTLKGVR